MTTVFMFPGQSSRSPGMFDRLLAVVPAAIDWMADASSVLGRDLAAEYAGPDSGFGTNRGVQVGVFLANEFWRRALAEAGIAAEASLGLSLGEYNHLVDIGAIGFEDALRLVDRRGMLYDRGPGGMMAAVMPIDVDELRALLARLPDAGVVEIGNINSPTQCVISGERTAVEAALTALADEYYIEGVVIERHVPMHSPVFAAVGGWLRPDLASAPWRRPVKPYVSNVLGAFVDAPSPATITALLEQHVSGTVQWRASVEAIIARWPDARFVEVGPRTVLCGLLGKRWITNDRVAIDGGEDEFAAAVASLQEPG
ncbi:MAG TPA: ACP S-malonyltransferase [Gammaproteobacteria bacterium]|nr:ACP S-malonyltransferase [Gammaproteobacteria bacterium]